MCERDAENLTCNSSIERMLESPVDGLKNAIVALRDNENTDSAVVGDWVKTNRL